MTATAHALAAGAIVATVSNPPLGLALAFISHPLLDIVPHWDAGWGWRQKSKTKLFIECAVDTLLGVILAFWIFGAGVDPIYMLLAIGLSTSWDFLEAPYWFLKWRFPPFSTIYNLQSPIQGKAAPPLGIITQILSVILIYLVLGIIKL